jgi:hypothetical protein
MKGSFESFFAVLKELLRTVCDVKGSFESFLRCERC